MLSMVSLVLLRSSPGSISLRELHNGSRSVPKSSNKRGVATRNARDVKVSLKGEVEPINFQLDSNEMHLISLISKTSTRYKTNELSNDSGKHSRRSKLKPFNNINSKAAVALAEATNRERLRRKKRNRPSVSASAQRVKKSKKYSESGGSFMFHSHNHSPEGMKAGSCGGM